MMSIFDFIKTNFSSWKLDLNLVVSHVPVKAALGFVEITAKLTKESTAALLLRKHESWQLLPSLGFSWSSSYHERCGGVDSLKMPKSFE
jgi:hypothetical protein